MSIRSGRYSPPIRNNCTPDASSSSASRALLARIVISCIRFTYGTSSEQVVPESRKTWSPSWISSLASRPMIFFSSVARSSRAWNEKSRSRGSAAPPWTSLQALLVGQGLQIAADRGVGNLHRRGQFLDRNLLLFKQLRHDLLAAFGGGLAHCDTSIDCLNVIIARIDILATSVNFVDH